MLFGKGFQHPDLVGHAGEVVEVLSYKEGESEVMVKAGGKAVKLSPIQDLTALADTAKTKARQCHLDLVRAGRYRAAWHVLRLLQKGRVTLGLSDCEHEAEVALERYGFRGCSSRNGNFIRFGFKPSYCAK